MAASLRIETVRGGMIPGAAIPPQPAGNGTAASIVDKAMPQAHAVCALALALAGANRHKSVGDPDARRSPPGRLYRRGPVSHRLYGRQGRGFARRLPQGLGPSGPPGS